ncbi:aminoglycoside N(3)-acetyltransferase [Cribrihabitans neustonicus]|uniref:aminoglycoside N(3)-acetyltransferase n=1 Tax=Cribrihabitans neustonicus TaxID=1429085 RepID=UPI003B591945
MAHQILSAESLARDLRALGVAQGDGLFVHASARAIGPVVGGARCIVEALLETIGPDGLLGMPAFSSDAYLPPHFDSETLSRGEIAAIELAVPGFDPLRSPASGMGIIAETFRTWPGTVRSSHPAVSICLHGKDAAAYAEPHSPAWATGPETPLGRLAHRRKMKILLIGVGWNRCSALHTAETLAQYRRTKLRRFKTGPGNAAWIETPDVADDLGRLFPAAGAAFEAAGQVGRGTLGHAECRICPYGALVDFASGWIGESNRISGARH